MIEYFAAIKAGGECLNDEFAYSLRKLHEKNIYPVVVHGGGPQIDKALQEAGIETRKIEGKRVTDRRALGVVVKTLKKVNQEFLGKLNDEKIYAIGLHDIFHVENNIDPVYEYVADRITTINFERIDQCLKNKYIPLISCLGISDSEQIIL